MLTTENFVALSKPWGLEQWLIYNTTLCRYPEEINSLDTKLYKLDYPNFVKILTVFKPLSTQIHPLYPSNERKGEMWVCVSEYAYIAIDKILFSSFPEDYRAKFNVVSPVAANMNCEKCASILTCIKLSFGDTFYVFPGMFHCLLNGVFIEIQENANTTLRFCDSHRQTEPRALHLEKIIETQKFIQENIREQTGSIVDFFNKYFLPKNQICGSYLPRDISCNQNGEDQIISAFRNIFCINVKTLFLFNSNDEANLGEEALSTATLFSARSASESDITQGMTGNSKSVERSTHSSQELTDEHSSSSHSKNSALQKDVIKSQFQSLPFEVFYSNKKKDPGCVIIYSNHSLSSILLSIELSEIQQISEDLELISSSISLINFADLSANLIQKIDNVCCFECKSFLNEGSQNEEKTFKLTINMNSLTWEDNIKLAVLFVSGN